MVGSIIAAEEIVEVATPVKLVTTTGFRVPVAILVVHVAAETVAPMVTPTPMQRDFAKARAASSCISSVVGSRISGGQRLQA